MARGDQLSRQWKIIHALLSARQGKTIAELARTAACHSRTVYRDLEALQMAGFPLRNEAIDGHSHWSMLDSGRRPMPLPLNVTELMALYFSRNMLKVLEGTAIHDSLTSLFEKVKATLPEQYIGYLDKLENSLQVGVKAHKAYQRLQEHLTTVNTAAQERHCVEMVYFSMSRRSQTRRKVAPYKIWFYDETFYIIGYCELRRQVRIFALDRIETLTVLEETFDLPDGFDAQAFMQPSFGVFQGDPVRVRIRFAPRTAGYIAEKIWHPSQALEPQADGGLIFTAEVAGIEEIKYWVLKWGAGATVLEPAELRTAIVSESQRMLANHAAEPAPSALPEESEPT